MKRTNSTSRSGFSLPLVMMIMAALVIMALALMSATGITRHGARAVTDAMRAECAARAALEECRGLLEQETANDDFLIIASPRKTADEPARLYLSRGEVSSAALKFRHVPLFSMSDLPERSERLEAPAVRDVEPGPEIRPLPWQQAARPQWLALRNDKGEVTSRYAWWAEDVQAKLNAKVAGNRDGSGNSHQRAAWPFPAAGLNPDEEGPRQPALDGIQLDVLDDSGELASHVIEGRPWLVSPQSMFAAAGMQPPLLRDEAGRLIDRRARSLEEHVSNGWPAYDERPTVPFVPDIDRAVMAKPKLNLNALLEKRRPSAVAEMAHWIDDGLPKFATRQGGFPDDYLKTLAANALDYADADSEASTFKNSYRGLDAYPLISEFLMRFKWEGVETVNGRKFVVLSVSTYVELWNMTDMPVDGRAQVDYQTRYRFALGALPEVRLDDEALLNDPEVCYPPLHERDGRRWFPSFKVTLKPNEMRVYRVGTVTYRLDAGPGAIVVPSPLTLDGDNAVSGYVMEWNGVVVDGARGMLNRDSASLNYPSDTQSKPRQKVRTTIPGHSYRRGSSYDNNMGDPRMAFYFAAPQDANSYPGNYSPNRRTVRWDTIYAGDSSGKPKVHGRVLPSEWPDGGHDAPYGSNAFLTNDQRILPDDARFFQGLAVPLAGFAPMRISNRGCFLSATELGHVYDPIMWKTAAPTNGAAWPLVAPGHAPSDARGGGNTLRIGRPEHPRFDPPDKQAVSLLDLFHAGKSRSRDASLRKGPLVRIEGHVNLNTASRDALRALAAGALRMDPELAVRTSETHETSSLMAPPTQRLELSAASRECEADIIADAIIRHRPYASPSEIARLCDDQGRPVFGNRESYPQNERIQWSDSAAEEVFARVYEASTVRSRNFRVWVVGQALASNGEVLAESRKVFTLFADPVQRAADGGLERVRTRVLYENDD